MTGADSKRERRFDALFAEHVAGIASYCRWRAPSSVDGEDAVAEVCLVVWRRLHEVPPGAEARAWLYAVARRVLANQARASARRERLSEKLGAQRVAIETEDAPQPPITPPGTSTPTPPVRWSSGPTCPPPPHGPCGG